MNDLGLIPAWSSFIFDTTTVGDLVQGNWIGIRASIVSGGVIAATYLAQVVTVYTSGSSRTILLSNGLEFQAQATDEVLVAPAAAALP